MRTSNSLVLVSDGDGIDDDPRTTERWDIDFITGALIERLYPRSFLNGDHELSLSYNYRRVHKQLGIPVTLDVSTGEVSDSFTQITNHDVTFEWKYTYFRDRYSAQQDVNPRDGRYLRFAYSHAWTDLFSEDATLNTPTDNYPFNRLVLNYIEYVPIPATNHHTLEIKFIGGYMDRDVNINDEFFAGGRLNFRAFGDISDNSTFYGYEDFSISGETLLLLSLSYRFPRLF